MSCGCGSGDRTACDASWRKPPTPISKEEVEENACSSIDLSSSACARLAEFRSGCDEEILEEDRPDQFGPCGPLGPGNQPVSDCDYRRSLGVDLQGIVDEARKFRHDFGLRPYRVFLVWQRRDARQEFREVKRVELMPVRVSNLTQIDLELAASGLQPSGTLALSEISPQQVDEHMLRGKLEGRDLASNEEFFYEVALIPRCDGDTPIRGRYTLAGVPFFDGQKFQWRVAVSDQENPRGPFGEDQTLAPTPTRTPKRFEVIQR